MTSIYRLALFATFAIGCAKAPPLPYVDAVHFDSGSTSISASEVDTIKEVSLLLDDANLYVLVMGRADPTGDAAVNKKLSRERAEEVKRQIIKAKSGGGKGKRILVRGRGEVTDETSEGSNAADRRVEFYFYWGKAGQAAPTAKTIYQNGQSAHEMKNGVPDSSSGAGDVKEVADDVPAKEKSDEKSSKNSIDLPIEKTGVADFDTFFEKVEAMAQSIDTANGRVSTAQGKMTTALGLSADISVEAALTSLKEQAGDSLEVSMDGTKPSVSASASAPQNVQDAVAAVNELADALVLVGSDLAPIPAEGASLATEASTVLSGSKDTIKAAGLGLTETAKVLKILKGNVKTSSAVPEAATDLLSNAAETLSLIGTVLK